MYNQIICFHKVFLLSPDRVFTVDFFTASRKGVFTVLLPVLIQLSDSGNTQKNSLPLIHLCVTKNNDYEKGYFLSVFT